MGVSNPEKGKAVTVDRVRIFLAGAFALLVPAIPGSAEGAGTGKLDLRLDQAPSASGIEGRWTYSPLDGGAQYAIAVVATPQGFYQFEGRRVSSGALVLQMDRATEGASFRGELRDGFDACIPAGARFTIGAVTDRIEIEPIFPVSVPFLQPPPGPCREAGTYALVAAGRGENLRLRGSSDLGLAPSGSGVAAAQVGGSYGTDGGSPPARQGPSATVTLDAPTAPDGSRVTILGSQKDVRGKGWFLVRLLEPVAAETEPGEGDREAGAEARGGDRAEGNPPAKDAGSAVEGDPGSRKKRTEPPSGYVPVENVVARWTCTLVREEAEGPPATDGRERR